MIQLQDDAQAARKIGPTRAKIEWVDTTPMPTREEQDRLDALALEEDDSLATGEDTEEDDEAAEEEVEDDKTDEDDKTNKDKDEKLQ